MNIYDKLVKEIESWKDFQAHSYVKNEVTKIITEPVTHIYVVCPETDDEYDIINDRGSWVITCERADASHLGELCMIVNMFEEDDYDLE